MNILVTGSKGFIGSHLSLRLKEIGQFAVSEIDFESSRKDLEEAVLTADIIYHLAGVNRPADVADFERGNYGLTSAIIDVLEKAGRRPLVVFSSSIQATLENPYGQSKRLAEEAVFSYAARTQAPVAVYRLPNVFGKWSKPNYNSVVATFCFNAAHGIPLQVDEPAREMDFVYIDDVLEDFVSFAMGRRENRPGSQHHVEVSPVLHISLGQLATTIQEIASSRKAGRIVDLCDPFSKYLGSMFLSYLPPEELEYSLVRKADTRGYLCELTKSPHGGQVFVSITKPGITRGNHYHHTKVEKFFVIKGSALVRLRHVLSGEVCEYRVQGEECRAVDIPPGFAHSISNVGGDDMIVLFWANEIFDPARPDTFRMEA